MWNNLRARHYSLLILLAIVALETSAIAIDKFINNESEAAFSIESSFQNNPFIQSFKLAEATSAPEVRIARNTGRSAQPELRVSEKQIAPSVQAPVARTLSASFVAASSAEENSVNYLEYSIQPGDSLSTIAAKFGTKTNEIKAANSIEDQHSIKAGQTIKVPTAMTAMSYTVQKGDSLSKIAAKFSVSMQDLVEENNLKSHILMADQKLRIPLRKDKKGLEMVKTEPEKTERKLDKVDTSVSMVASEPRLELVKSTGSRLQIVREMAPASKPDTAIIEQSLMANPPVINRAAAKPEKESVDITVSARSPMLASLPADNASVQTSKPAEVKASVRAETKPAAVEAAAVKPAESVKAASEEKKPDEKINYTVAKGDSLLKIAHKYNTTVAQIQEDNKMSDTMVKLGQSLVLQPGKKLYKVVKASQKSESEAKKVIVSHKVAKGESLSTIARKYSTTISAIIAANSMSNTVVMAGETIKVPTTDSKDYKVAKKSSTASKLMSFRTPVRGRLSERYGWRIHPIRKTRQFHAGIDLAAAKGTPIIAAAAGKVVFSGRQNGYGKIVIISHANGYSTRYAHCSSLLVKQGQTVKAGQLIAKVGSTGVSTGNHLHFEIRKNGKTQNPYSYIK